ncbi:HAD-IC family P-type ATPase [Patescibacteria group bacterium]|nr:HAD-IC family P-type ATPase [Patescibacteria group bacterium]MBU1705564.1 HAD-IC family P-type ATPase [Patescibacteria group bacterium]
MTGGTKAAWHALSAKQALHNSDSSTAGLKPAQVAARQKKYGANVLPHKKPVAGGLILLRQFGSPLIIILLAAVLISLALGESVDAAVIFAAVLVNTVIGFVQEYKANRALEKLRSYLQPFVSVRRDGREKRILAEKLVPGDLVLLRTGDKVVADLRLLEAVDLEISEAALTGESLPVSKQTEKISADTVLAERANLAYAGTHIVAGTGLGVVLAIGSDTELGQIAELVQSAEDAPTPLQAELKRLAKWLSAAVVLIVLVILALGLSRGFDLLEMFETSVALAVAAVPEGLIVTITIILAIGAQKIFKRKALVRRIVASETLGSVSVICSDKTGTITEGEMRVGEIVPLSGPIAAGEVSHVQIAPETMMLLEASILCNDATVTGGKKLEKVEVVGSPTEKALMEAGLQAGIEYRALLKRHARLDAVPFDSSRKYMATLNQWPAGPYLLVKGAPEYVIDFSDSYLQADQAKSLSKDKRRELKQLAVSMANRGLRVLGVAYRPEPQGRKKIADQAPNDLVFLGFMGLSDPLRPEAREQIRRTQEAGVRTIIITGDHPSTALAIAKEAGLAANRQTMAMGAQVDRWSDRELKAKVKTLNLFARAEPKHKIRIIKAWQAHGQVVAMTGDGVNDAPALKAADIGVALGSGTEVAKEASDLVLLDNNLGTITAAIEEGRVMFDNIRKTAVYLMTDSFTEIVLIGGALLLGLPLPLLATQILWINLIADSLPAIALAMEPGEPDIMRIKPRPRREPVLNQEMLTYIFGVGLITDLVLFALYAWYLAQTGDPIEVRSVMFAAVGIDSLLYVFAFKSFRRSIFRTNPFSNLWLLGAVGVGFGLMLFALLHPFMQLVFEIVPLSLSDWLVLLMIGVVKLMVIEGTKEWFIHRRGLGTGN